jgi:para-aminobenzoate synthetase/4-amino-4-deoxychorismate lyase
LERHLDRLRSSAEYFGFVFDDIHVHAMLDEVATKNPLGTWRVRLLLARDGKVTTECFPLEPTPAEVRVTFAKTAIDSRNEFLQHKTTERDIYAPHQPGADIFDTLLFNERDEITEFTRGNIVVELDGQRVTPPLSCGLLAGVLRSELLSRGEVSERVITRADVKRAKQLWFANSVRGLIPARLLAD